MNALRPRATVRPFRQWGIAGAFGLAWFAIMLGGADRPPPQGFVAVVIGLAALVVALGLTIPFLWRVQRRRGRPRVLGVCAGIGAGIGLALAILFALQGSGEPSVPPPSVAARATWIGVVTALGAVNGTLVGIVTVVCRPRS